MSKTFFSEKFYVALLFLLENHKVQLDAVYGNVNNIELNGVQFCCLYGGRTSPNSVCNDGAIVILQILMDTLIPKLIIHDENLIPRYRSSMVSLSVKKNEVQIWIFGGRSADSFVSIKFTKKNY